MFLFEQKFSGMDSNFEKPCQNRSCETKFAPSLLNHLGLFNKKCLYK